MSNDLFGGMEGGATKTSLVIYNGLGEKIIEHKVHESTNHWTIGMPKCIKIINQIVKEALVKSDKYSEATKLKCLGLCLSGCEDDEYNEILKKALMDTYPDLSEDYIVCSDTIAPIAVAHSDGGAVIIAGTGSNALLINPSGKQARCGGWGPILGDEGSAYMIACHAVKTCLDVHDGIKYLVPNETVDRAWHVIKQHFNIENRSEPGMSKECLLQVRQKEMLELLKPFYANYNKSNIAELCEKLSIEAKNGDCFCKYFFEEAGVQLAKMVQSLYKNAEKEILHKDGGLPIVCSGSVWKSWDLIKPGFVCQLVNKTNVNVKEFSLIKLKVGHDTGAVYLAAKHVKYNFPVNNKDTNYVFYHYKTL